MIVHGDLTLETADVIVNSSNVKLAHTGTLSEALVNKAGDGMVEENQYAIHKNGDIVPGEIVVTSPGNLNCKKIFHAICPVYCDG